MVKICFEVKSIKIFTASGSGGGWVGLVVVFLIIFAVVPIITIVSWCRKYRTCGDDNDDTEGTFKLIRLFAAICMARNLLETDNSDRYKNCR